MKYCKICLQPDTRPGTIFISQVCPACHFLNDFDENLYKEEYTNLINILRQKATNRRGFDSILGVSGGKDSTKQALFAREKLGLNPLLVAVVYPPEQVSKVGISNLNNLIDLGFCVEVLAPAVKSWKTLMKRSFFEFGNWAKPTELALFSGVPRIAIEKEINLILWGENPALQIGASDVISSQGWDGNNSRNLNTIRDIDRDWLLKCGLKLELTNSYIYPSQEDFINNKLQIIYLGWMMEKWSLLENGVFAVLNGLKFRLDTPINTSDLVGTSSIDEDFVIVNQMIKFYKFGFGKTTEYLNELIRAKKISREDAIDIATEYDGACSDKYIAKFCNYLSISQNEFWEVVNAHTNKQLFHLRRTGRPIPKFKVGQDLIL